jgi:copper oxidase (laccase) domain-containing protein
VLAGICATGVSRMSAGCRTSDLVALIGPHIGPC